ncbi:MAG: T9SS type A sorting domain-containing protein [Flammeovirgaceae bacterium]|nr:T9SS type A sorting domain-containing protein [Flammeovirgaceae bacterium]MBK8292456.1 T9SS type A sorting domain-containing protein [Flammeovirgaceae bacterium]
MGWSIDNLYIQLKPTGINEITPVTKLSAFPNPTTGPVTISYSVTQKTNVDVEVYDWVGKRFITLSLGSKEPGEYSQTLTLPTKSGTYLLTLKTNTTKQVFKVIVSD